MALFSSRAKAPSAKRSQKKGYGDKNSLYPKKKNSDPGTTLLGLEQAPQFVSIFG